MRMIRTQDQKQKLKEKILRSQEEMVNWFAIQRTANTGFITNI